MESFFKICFHEFEFPPTSCWPVSELGVWGEGRAEEGAVGDLEIVESPGPSEAEDIVNVDGRFFHNDFADSRIVEQMIGHWTDVNATTNE